VLTHQLKKRTNDIIGNTSAEEKRAIQGRPYENSEASQHGNATSAHRATGACDEQAATRKERMKL